MITLHKDLIIYVFLIVIFLPTPAMAVSAQDAAAINHLIEFIAQSKCSFVRNGVTYNSSAAARHIKRKYEHIKKKINSTEEFITYAASGSSTSGKPYFVECKGSEPQSSKGWLMTELYRYRKANSQANE